MQRCLLHFLFVAVCTLVLSGLLFPRHCAADLEWIRQAQSCEEFAVGLNRAFGRLERADQLSEAERKELAVVFQEACNFQFAECFPRFCREQFEKRRLMSQQQHLGPESSAIAAGAGPAATEDEFAWLNKPLKCGELLDNIGRRYTEGGKLKLSAEKKAALKDLLCSERFIHCGYCRR